MAEKRPSMTDILKGAVGINVNRGGKTIDKVKDSKMQRIINSLQWRQAFMNQDSYQLRFDNGSLIPMTQISNGEMKGLGTGSFVWPAAHVLCMYIEKKYGTSKGLLGKRIIDIGAGTGAAGFAAALCGAKVTLSDQEQILFLAEENKQLFLAQNPEIDPENILIKRYDWGANASELGPVFDVVLVSDCVLPKLYPIDILIEGVDAVMGPHTVAYFSYEHRPYPSYDPRQEFERLAALRGMQVRVIPLTEHHAVYSAEDIEIWEVTKCDASVATVTSSANSDRNNNSDSQGVGTSAIFYSWGEVPIVQFNMCGVQLSLKQRLNGLISDMLWPSSALASRLVLQYDCNSLRAKLGMHCPRQRRQPSVEGEMRESVVKDAVKPTAVDLGAGCGLCSMALALRGYDVVSTDIASALNLLMENMEGFRRTIQKQKQQELQSESAPARCGAVEVKELDWRAVEKCMQGVDGGEVDAKDGINSRHSGTEIRQGSVFSHAEALSAAAVAAVAEAVKNIKACKPDLIVCSDCIYSTGAISPLLTVLENVSL